MKTSLKLNETGSKESSSAIGSFGLKEDRSVNRLSKEPSVFLPNNFHLGKVPILSQSEGVVQPKLSINTPGDKYEQEADQVADQIMRMPNASSNVDKDSYGGQQQSIANNISSVSGMAQRKCSACEEEDKIQTKSKAQGSQTASSSLTHQIRNSKGGGKAMDQGTNSFMSSRFGSDFSGVRIHTNNSAVEMNNEIQARAFTVGNNVYFNRGEYQPNSDEGKKLLAHELTHVVQQGNGSNVISRKPNFTDLEKQDETPFFGEGEVIQRKDKKGKKKKQKKKSCKTICNDAYKDASLNFGGGGVICDGAKKCPCVFDVPPLKKGECSDFDKIVRFHERKHKKDVDCDSSKGLHRPPFRDPSHAIKSECKHRKKSVKQMKRKIKKSKGKCKTGMESIKGQLETWISANC